MIEVVDTTGGIFKNKRIVFSKLEPFGFEKSGDGYVYRNVLSESGFEMTVTVSNEGNISAEVVDPEIGDRYVLHLIDGAQGSFVGGVRRQYGEVLSQIAGECFETDIFKTEQAKEIIRYVKSRYGDELEFLWERFPENAVWRRRDTGKWYAALLTAKRSKIGLDGEDMAEILDFRVPPEEVGSIVDGRAYFPGYHMNKKHWVTAVLNGAVPTREICERIDESYKLAVK